MGRWKENNRSIKKGALGGKYFEGNEQESIVELEAKLEIVKEKLKELEPGV